MPYKEYLNPPLSAPSSADAPQYYYNPKISLSSNLTQAQAGIQDSQDILIQAHHPRLLKDQIKIL